MVSYVIAFSLIMVFLSALTVTICVFVCRDSKNKLEQSKNASADKSAGEKAFAESYANGQTSAFVIIDAKTLQPVFVSRNVDRFFGVSADDLYCDVESVKNGVDKTDFREFKRAFSEWDRNSVFAQEFGYGADKYAKLEAFACAVDGVDYVAFTFYDITEQKNSQIAMQKELNDALGQAAAKSSFLSSMSHEIRTPMNGVMGMLSLARMNIDDRDKALGYLERAGDLSSFLLSLINDILDISKIESGKMQLFNTQMDIFAFADKIRNMFNSTVTAKGIDFVVETVDFTARYVVTDEMRLTQVVTNLVSNANKFTPKGGKITVTFKQLDFIGGKMQTMIRVRDTGKGIAPENIHKIMKPFEQEEASTSHNYGGTGLGLAICDNIVRLMGGNIVVDSVLGKGTDFSVFLSLELADVHQDMTTPVVYETAEPQDKEFTYEGCRILLAEDNEVNAEIAVEMLESEGAKVTHAKDGQEAVDVFTQNPPNSFDLILMDVHMPRLNGHDAARAIRKSDKSDADSVPIIALSADAFVEDIKLSEAAGMDGHVSKPIDFAVLKQRAGEIIAAKKRKSSKQ